MRRNHMVGSGGRTDIENGGTGHDGLPVNRRSFLKATGAGAALGALAGCLGGFGGSDGYTFGAIYILSGFASVYGDEAERGIEMALDEINNDGGIDGEEVEVLTRDSEASAETAIRHARSLVEEDNVDALFGLDSSGVGLGVAPVIPDLDTTLIVTHAATPFITAPEGSHERAVGNEHVFRASNNLAQNIYGAAQVAAELDATSWTTIGPDYAFGHDTWEYFQAFTEGLDLGLEFLDDGVSFPELASDDYTPHVRRVLRSEPEAVITSLWGADLLTFLDQAQEANFFDEVDHFLVSVGMGTDLPTEGNPLPEGIWASTRYWFLEPDTQENRTFREDYVDRFDTYPTYNAEGAYRGIHLYKKAIEEAGSADTDDLIDQLTGMEHTGAVGDYTLSPETGQATVPGIWGVVSYSEEWESNILDPVELYPTSRDELTSVLDHSGLPPGV